MKIIVRTYLNGRQGFTSNVKGIQITGRLNKQDAVSEEEFEVEDELAKKFLDDPKRHKKEFELKRKKKD